MGWLLSMELLSGGAFVPDNYNLCVTYHSGNVEIVLPGQGCSRSS